MGSHTAAAQPQSLVELHERRDEITDRLTVLAEQLEATRQEVAERVADGNDPTDLRAKIRTLAEETDSLKRAMPVLDRRIEAAQAVALKVERERLVAVENIEREETIAVARRLIELSNVYLPELAAIDAELTDCLNRYSLAMRARFKADGATLDSMRYEMNDRLLEVVPATLTSRRMALAAALVNQVPGILVPAPAPPDPRNAPLLDRMQHQDGAPTPGPSLEERLHLPPARRR